MVPNQDSTAPKHKVPSRPSEKETVLSQGPVLTTTDAAGELRARGGRRCLTRDCGHTYLGTHRCSHTSLNRDPTVGRPSSHFPVEPGKQLSLSSKHTPHVLMTCSPGSQNVLLSHLAPSCCSSDALASFLTQEMPNRNRPTHFCVLTFAFWNMNSALTFPTCLTSRPLSYSQQNAK